MLRKGSKKMYRSGAWNGQSIKGSGMLANQVNKYNFVWNNKELYFMHEISGNAIISKLTLNQSGMIQLSVQNEGDIDWINVFTVQYDLCNTYGQCGPNGICRISKIPICECLEGFIPISQREWDGLNWMSGCVRGTPTNCEKRDWFRRLGNVKLPDLKLWLNKSMSLKDCRRECPKNCSCTAFASSDIGRDDRTCFIWFGNLTDLRELDKKDSEQDIYFRMAASEQDSMTIENEIELPLFDMATIATTTDNFSGYNMIGEGGFGRVYKGKLSSGQEITVKRLSQSSRQGLQEFKNEVVLIAKLQHRNLVRLLGCCIEGEEMMLIYEYMPNKSLDYFIFEESRKEFLTWENRFEISMGISRGLLYLHQDSRLRIIHRDLKTSNILLDSDLNARISDFGLARSIGGDQYEAQTTRVIGTFGYTSPEYAVDGKFSTKSDVFSLGVLLLEIVSGAKNRKFSHPDHHHNLLGHAWLL
ncbi:G-type lectin S-receptor-like serine/threonine-protein kinase At4g27290 [Olea europaea var. sylvestris]|uniref:G-type lectin S-receptor-like serine/threonine-protein kinase At4g27290 n=1 Tax=Olea europaea var. sylvestris TaxID=158386 RepID=UPI000C1D374B|nr:G-type lectin S-receptor-like serine/threonine-protein kinase At4g27290 [Olea europaea var. sylvestris]